MKKLVISSMMLADRLIPVHYPPKGNFVEDYNEKVHYAVNAYLAKTLKETDEFKVLLLKTTGGAEAGEKNAKVFIDELNGINSQIGAKIDYKIIDIEFDPSNVEFQKIFTILANEIKEYKKCDLIADFTYGAKTTPILLLSVLQFVQKFFECRIRKILYGKVEFEKGNIIPGSEALYDVTPLYTLISLTNNMNTISGEKALEAINEFFEL